MLAFGAPVVGQPAPPSPVSTAPFSADDWRADLDQLIVELPKRHVNAFFRTAQADFEAAAADLRGRLDGMSDTDRALSFARLAASLGDAHTSIDISRFQAASRLFPIALYPASDGLLIVGAPSEASEMNGSEMLAVNGTPIAEVVARMSTLYAWENQASRLGWLRRWFAMSEAHRFLGITPTADECEVLFRPLLTPDAQPRSVTIRAVTRPELDATLKTLPRPAPGPAALSQRRETRALWFDFVTEAPGVMYVRYDRCANDPQATIAQYAESVLARIDAGGVRRLIIDLRANGGGDSSLLDPFIAAIAERPEFRGRGAVIALIGRNTFSSAQLNAHSLRQRAGAVVIGGPTGQKPNAYGEVRQFALDRTGLRVFYSTKRFVTAEGDPESMMPDVLAEPTMRDTIAGRDVALEAAIAFTAGPASGGEPRP